MPGAFDFGEPEQEERETREKPATARRTRDRGDEDSGGGRSVNTALLVALLILVMIGISIGGGAFYYYAVYLPRQREISDLHDVEMDFARVLKHQMEQNTISGEWRTTTTREEYDESAERLKRIHERLRSLGTRPYASIPPYQPPTGN